MLLTPDSHFLSTFAPVKTASTIHRLLLAALFVLSAIVQARAADGGDAAAGQAGRMDSVEISLITCSPHEEIYSLYGHTALRLHDLKTGEDWAFNYGVFNYHQPFFVLRFVFGRTDYELGVAPFPEFCKFYRRWGSQVSELVLSLTPEEKRRVIAALDTNYLPQNRVYRYNFFFDNCATRPRDLIERNLSGRIDYPARQGDGPSFRAMIHEHTVLHPWAALGNDLLLGVRADQPTTQREQHFLPERLEADFMEAHIVARDGSRRPLVSERRIVVPHGFQVVEREFPLSPLACAVVLLLLSLAVFAVEWRRHRTLVWWDALLMSATGLAGCVIVVMFFSEHPATSSNLQVLLLNPIHLFFLPAVVRRKPATRYWTLLPCLVVLFFVGSLWQHYAEGLSALALCLLTRYCSHLRNDK